MKSRFTSLIVTAASVLTITYFTSCQKDETIVPGGIDLQNIEARSADDDIATIQWPIKDGKNPCIDDATIHWIKKVKSVPSDPVPQIPDDK